MILKNFIGSLVQFKAEGNYLEFHNAIGMVISQNKPSHVRVRWIKPVHYAKHTARYKIYGPATVSDFAIHRFEVINESR